jgi:hypothetical protein
LPHLAPIIIKKYRRRYEELGLDEVNIERGLQNIQELLATQGPVTRHELVPHLVVLLAERYLSACGPATSRDFSAWLGLPCLGFPYAI